MINKAEITMINGTNNTTADIENEHLSVVLQKHYLRQKPHLSLSGNDHFFSTFCLTFRTSIKGVINNPDARMVQS